MEILPGNKATGSRTGRLSKPEERLFTKDEVNELMQKRVARSHKAFFDRYGVKDLNELDTMLGQAKGYESIKTQYDDLTNQHADLTKKYAYKVGNINPDKYNDIETYFKGKNLAITEENLTNELKTHPDWVNKVSGIMAIGQEDVQTDGGDTEAQIASKYLGVDLTN